MIFVWHHAEDAAPNWYPKPVTQISNGTWKFQARNEFYVNCHIQVNFDILPKDNSIELQLFIEIFT